MTSTLPDVSEVFSDNAVAEESTVNECPLALELPNDHVPVLLTAPVVVASGVSGSEPPVENVIPPDDPLTAHDPGDDVDREKTRSQDELTDLSFSCVLDPD
jgi:hypothetical protein